MTRLILKPEFSLSTTGEIINQPIIIPTKYYKKEQIISLPNQVLLPGFVNAHSHSFQRGLRGLVEKNTNIKNNFWSWRNPMYQLANQVSLDFLEQITSLLYIELVESGFTHVGEFHYLHHDLLGKPYLDPLAPIRAIKKAAQLAQINICFLPTAYTRAGFDNQKIPEQARFYHHNIKNFLELCELSRNLHNNFFSSGVAIHSVRAVPTSWFAQIREFQKKYSCPLHIHACEQKQEIQDCKNFHDQTPIGLLNNFNLINKNTTLIHATYLNSQDLEIISKFKNYVCICSSTEKNLGDGIPNITMLRKTGAKLCIGTDQHVRTNPFDESRSIEELERLRSTQRTVINSPGAYLYKELVPILCHYGRGSLNINDYDSPTALLPQNLVSIELPCEYQFHGPQVALDSLMISGQPKNISTVITNGQIVVHEGKSLCKEKNYLLKEIRTFFHKKFLH